MRNSWTDDRLDDFAAHTGHRFDAVDKRFDAVDMRFEAVDRRFDAVDKRFDRVDAELQRINGRIDGLQRTLLQTNAVIIAALLGLIATQL